MNKIFKLLVLVTVFCNITGAEVAVSKKNPIIISDFDKVWINAKGLVYALAELEPIKSLLQGKSSTRKISESEKKQKKIHKFTLNLLDYGSRHPNLVPYIPQLIEYFGKSRCINQPIHNLYRHLKYKGCTIVIATNKDRMLYDFAIEALGNEIPDMVDKVFVSEPINDESAIATLQAFANKPTTPKKYKDMVYKAIEMQPTTKIFHVPSKKPYQRYFTYVVDHLGPDNDMIFIDDNVKNVEAFNALQKNCPHLRRGILYKQNNPGQLIDELIKLNLVSEKEDKKLLHDIRYPGKSKVQGDIAI